MYSPSPMTMHDPAAMLIMIPSDWHQNSKVPEIADDELGDFDGISKDGTPRGLLFPTSPAFSWIFYG